MAAVLGAFLLWLFATGKFSDWQALTMDGGTVANWGTSKSPITNTSKSGSDNMNVKPDSSADEKDAMNYGDGDYSAADTAGFSFGEGQY